ncbi:MAG TPA: glycerol-3-phosphate acyltransferase, partial [Ruminococcaceae bacterium]|nr:glycerol-3-phosphate acyltransferase [Oscillospiraceae bacterium]
MHPDALAARLACILLGYLFGSFLTAEVVARVVSGKSARQ